MLYFPYLYQKNEEIKQIKKMLILIPQNIYNEIWPCMNVGNNDCRKLPFIFFVKLKETSGFVHAIWRSV